MNPTVVEQIANFNIVIFLLLINLLVSFVYLVIKVIEKEYAKGLMMTLFMILVPLIGPAYLFVSWAIYHLYFKNRQGILSMEELSLSKERVEIIERGSLEAARNRVPVEEALIISSSKDTRKLLLDILKDNTSEYISSIYHATDHEDSEVSHYAASAITDIINKFKQKEKALRELYRKDKTNRTLIDSYWDLVKDFLETKIFSQVEQERYVNYLEEVLKDIEKNKNYQVSGEMYYTLAVLYIDLNKSEKAKYWVDRGLENRPEDLETHKAALRLHYANKDGAKLLEVMKDLMESSIRLDQETLEFIRFYNQ